MGLLDKLKKKGEEAVSSASQAVTEKKNALSARAKGDRRVMVIGLDCAPPEHIFDEYAGDIPNLTKLRENGVYGPLESIVPPITVPAWACMMTSKDPGTLGIYGFRNRKDHTYDGLEFATSFKVKEPAVWDILSDNDKQCIVMSVPPMYPPKPVNGIQIGCFLTPNNQAEYTYPKELKQELESNVGEFIFDIRNFRTDNTQYILDEAYKMTDMKFKTADYLLSNKPWDFFMMVEMGPDRLNHGIWSFIDPNHPRYEPDNPYQGSLREYYRFLDGKIGDLLKHADEDTTVLVVSDHGAKAMVGGVCFNEWLRSEGYLAFSNEPDGVTPLNKMEIDWSKTTAWGDGGYYGRLFLNVEGREPEGVIPASDHEKVRDELIRKIEAMVDHEGKPMGNKALKPEDIYQVQKGVAPDLIVIFGELRWRSVGSLGHGSHYTFENDTGPDEANHAEQGIFIMNNAPGHGGGTMKEGLHLWDVHSTILDLFDLEPAPGALGTSALKK